MKAKINENSIVIDGWRFFTKLASDVNFGAYGDKKSPLTGQNYLDVEGFLPEDKLAKVPLIVTEVEVSSIDEKGLNLFLKAKIPGLVKADIGIKLGDITGGKIKLLKISPKGEGTLRAQFNDSPRILNKLIDYGGSARVVQTVLIAMEHETFKKFDASVTSNGAVMIDGVMVGVERSANWKNETHVSVGPGTCIGYSLAEPQWDAKQDKNKTKIEDLRDDEKGAI
jgi:hypothetical protein